MVPTTTPISIDGLIVLTHPKQENEQILNASGKHAKA